MVTHCHESVLVTVPVVTCHYRLIQAKAPFCPTAVQMLGCSAWASMQHPASAAPSSLPMPAFLPGSKKGEGQGNTRFRAGFVLGTRPVLSAG